MVLSSIVKFSLQNRWLSVALALALIALGLAHAPFRGGEELSLRAPIPVDAIPDIGENQQIVYTPWEGRSPEDIETQITYPLSTFLLGLPGLRVLRGSSTFGRSSIYIIFEEDIGFYWSRSRILEKLKALPEGLLPADAQPSLGPDATGLGQVYWYTLEGQDAAGHPTGGWDLEELRRVQDFVVKYSLMAVEGVSEVSSVGGFVREYQVDVDPLAMKAYGVTLPMVSAAIQSSNQEVGARTLEINRVEYMVRGLGYIRSKEDLEQAVVSAHAYTPVLLEHVAEVHLGPAPRRGALDKAGAETVGGVVVVRYGENPYAVIQAVKEKIAELEPSLPKKTLSDGTVSQLRIVSFYDRSSLIRETIGTLEKALTLETVITVIVILFMLWNLRASLLVSSLVPLSVLVSFIGMYYLDVDANIVSLSGIAIAIGSIVDMGIVLSENMLKHMSKGPSKEPFHTTIYKATREVLPSMATATATTLVSLLPVFALEQTEGKLFHPLALTKTLVLLSAFLITVCVLPPLAHIVLKPRSWAPRHRYLLHAGTALLGLAGLFFAPWAGMILLTLGLGFLAQAWLHQRALPFVPKHVSLWLLGLVIVYFFSITWLPLGAARHTFAQVLFVAGILLFFIGGFYVFSRFYTTALSWCLRHKIACLSVPSLLLIGGLLGFLGVEKTLPVSAEWLRDTALGKRLAAYFPGFRHVFIPPFDEGAFLLMPSSTAHGGMEENLDNLQILDRALANIPEVASVVGKLGRAESALDPAPISMYEIIILYKPEYKSDANGHPLRFAVDAEGHFLRDADNALIEDPKGPYFRQWREHIRSQADIWEEISSLRLAGVTGAPKLQPIETRLLMLQTGMRAPIGIKVKGHDHQDIENASRKLERVLKNVQGVKGASVFAEQLLGKPYVEIHVNRAAAARYGLRVGDVQAHVETAIGGKPLSMHIEKRERYAIRLRYARALRDHPEALEAVLISAPGGRFVPLGQVAEVRYAQGPQMIRSEDTWPVNYITFEAEDDYTDVEVVEKARAQLRRLERQGQLGLPEGVHYTFAGAYENQLRAQERLGIIVPVVVLIVFFLLYLQFRSVRLSLIVFSGLVMAFGGGMFLLWLYGQEGFLAFSIGGVSLREVFHIQPIHMSVSVWVGFITLFGMATDNGVLMIATLEQLFKQKKPVGRAQLYACVREGGKRRLRPCLMTAGTTILAFLPVLSATGKGAQLMIPMVVPCLGGMLAQGLSLFLIPLLYAMWKEGQQTKEK